MTYMFAEILPILQDCMQNTAKFVTLFDLKINVNAFTINNL